MSEVLSTITDVVVLVVRVRHRRCALPIEHVIETMRPLPIDPVDRAPIGVLGLSIVRGIPVAVVDPGAWLGGAEGEIARFVTVRIGARVAALAVQSVEGVSRLRHDEFASLPLALGEAGAAIDRLATLDSELVLVLRATRLVPDAALALADAVPT